MPPLFFRKPAPLDPALHGERGLRRRPDYGFARGTNAIPISLSEIAVAAVWYPVVFADEAGARPIAIVGLRADENLYVDAKGRWLQGAYVPAYVRCYPFILADGPDAPGPTLCVDDTPEALVVGGQPLFRQGAPTALVTSAVHFCEAFRAAEAANPPFAEALAHHALLVPRTASARLGGGQQVQLGGFLTVDEAAFRALPDEVFLRFRRQSWLSALYAQIGSAMNWTRLADLLAARQAEEAA
jgi:hypothetical protein